MTEAPRQTTRTNGIPEDLNWVKSFLVSDEDDDDEVPLIYIDGIPIGSTGNHSLIIGKKKSRKTLLLVLQLKEYSGDIEQDVLWFDTEQGKKHCRKLKDKIKDITGKRLNIFFLRGQEAAKRRKIISKSIELWPTRPKIIIIDGIRDCMIDPNDTKETPQIISWIEDLLVKYGVHIINILHMNKNDTNPRGHLGTELSNKAQTVIEVEKDRTTGLTNVKCGDSRDEPFTGFTFGHDENGLPFVFNGQTVKNIILADEEIKQRLRNIFENEIIKRSAVIQGIRDHFKVGTSKADQLLTDFIYKKHWIMKNGKDRSPNTDYKQNFV